MIFKFFELLAIIAISSITALRVNSGNLQFINIACYTVLIFGILIKTEYLLYLISFLLPVGNLYRFQTGLMLNSLLMLIYIVKSCYDYFHRKQQEQMTTSVLFLLYSLCLSIFATVFSNASIFTVTVFYFHLFFILVAVKINHIYDEKYYYSILLFFVSGTVFVGLFSLLYPTISFYISNINREDALVNAGFSSSWDFGRSTIVSISFLIVLLLSKKINSILAIALIAFLFYVSSRSARFTMLIGLFFMFASTSLYYFLNKKGPLLFNLLLFSLFPIIAFFALSMTYDSMIEVRGVEASENGRYEIWNTYLSYLNSHLYIFIIGTGGGTISNIAENINTLTAHNLILEKIIEFGLLGLSVLLAFFSTLYNKSSFNIKNNVKLIPLLTYLGTTLTQGTTGSITFAFLLSIFLIQPQDNTKCEEKITHDILSTC